MLIFNWCRYHRLAIVLGANRNRVSFPLVNE